MRQAIVIFSGFNQRAVLAFIRTLESRNVPYGIIAASPEDTILKTAYATKVCAVRKVRQLQLEDLTESLKITKSKLGTDRYLIAPSTEALNRFLIEKRNEFESLDCEIPLVKALLYEVVSDKYKFGELCSKHGIRVPKEYHILEDAPIPCVAKPRQYYADNGETHSPVLIKNEVEKEEFLGIYNPREFYFQEYIKGASLYLLYYFYRDGTVAKFSQENFIQQPNGKSMLAAESCDFHNNKESEKYEKLFKTITYWGLVMVEVKEMSGEYFMIEANPRFWGPSQLFVDASNNLFEAFLHDNGIIADKPSLHHAEKKIRYFWDGGLHESMRDYGYVDYHNYSKEKFDAHRDDWKAFDVYNRDDSREIYKREMEV